MPKKPGYAELEQRVRALERDLAVLQESEQKYRVLTENVMDVICALDMDMRVTFCSRSVRRLLGYSPEEAMARGLEGLMSPASYARTAAVFREEVLKHERNEQTGEPFRAEIEIIRRDGTPLMTEVHANFVYGPDGRPKAVVGILRDIAQQKEAERALQYLELLLRAVEQAAEAIVITDPKGNIEYVNPSFERITGYSRVEAAGKNPRILRSGKQDETFYKDLWQTITAGKIWKNRLINRRKDGSLYTEEMSISPVLDRRGIITHFVAVKRDVTAEIDMEKRLAQAQKMEAIGNLAGGIAHDFNNILSPIILHAEMAMTDLPEDSPLQVNIGQIYQSAERARELVKQILTFARAVEQDKIPLRASLIVKEALRFMRATIPSSVAIRHEITTDRDTVLADPTRLHQVLMNLCANAAYAMQDKGGRLEVTVTEAHVGPDEAAGLGEIAPGDYLKLSVSDTGPGIPPDVIDKIFEPYFTTKAPDRGTGLGLAVVRAIVRDCNGHIAVESEVGKGSVFHVYLPLVDAPVSLDAERKTELPGGTERILLVDDEEAAIIALQPALERLGYRVTATTESLKALDLFRGSPHGFDLVITDQAMPHLTGKDLAAQLMRLRPDIPIVLCTGYSEQINEELAGKMGIRAFVPKPLVMRDLAVTIRKALDRHFSVDH